MNDLKRCPFCGNLPETEVRVTQMGGGEDYIDFSIVCKKCGTYKTVRLKVCKTAYFMDVDKAMADVVKAWNTRSGEDG